MTQLINDWVQSHKMDGSLVTDKSLRNRFFRGIYVHVAPEADELEH